MCTHSCVHFLTTTCLCVYMYYGTYSTHQVYTMLPRRNFARDFLRPCWFPLGVAYPTNPLPLPLPSDPLLLPFLLPLLLCLLCIDPSFLSRLVILFGFTNTNAESPSINSASGEGHVYTYGNLLSFSCTSTPRYNAIGTIP